MSPLGTEARPLLSEQGDRLGNYMYAVSIDAWLAFAFLAFLAIAALVPHALAWGDPYATDPINAFQAPSWHHLFGTDHAGRDIYTRIIFGVRQSMIIGLLSTGIGIGGGLFLGLLSALGPRAVDVVVGRFIEVLFVFPTILMALVFIALLGTGTGPLIVAVGVGMIPDAARLIRAQALKVKNGDFVVASLALGRSSTGVLFATILPNVIRSIFVVATLAVGQALLWASSLSFLGLGAAPPSPEWGVMLADGRDYLQAQWWISFFPGSLITLSVLSLTVAGRYLQRRSEGR